MERAVKTNSARRDPVGWDHAVQFYESDDFLCDAVAQFLSDGLLMGEPLVVLTTQAHRDGIVERMKVAGLDWEEARRSRRLRWMDARAALETVMMGRVPDPQRFRDHIGGLIRSSLNGGPDGGPHQRVRAYGEMVDLLWREGDADGALVLEDLWNDLGRTLSFSLLCAYGKGNVYRESHGERYREVCRRHSHVLPSETTRA